MNAMFWLASKWLGFFFNDIHLWLTHISAARSCPGLQSMQHDIPAAIEKAGHIEKVYVTTKDVNYTWDSSRSTLT